MSADLLAYAVDLCGAAQSSGPEQDDGTFEARDSCGKLTLRGQGSAVVITDLRGLSTGPVVCRSQAAVRAAVAWPALPAAFSPTSELDLITPLGRLSGPVYAPHTLPTHRPQAQDLQCWLKGPGLGGHRPTGPLELLVYERSRPDRFCEQGQWRDLGLSRRGLEGEAHDLGLHLAHILFSQTMRDHAHHKRAQDTGPRSKFWTARSAAVRPWKTR